MNRANDEQELIDLIAGQRLGGEMEFWEQAVATDQSVFGQLYQLTFNTNRRISWRSCWIIDTVSESSPELLKPYIPEIIDRLASEKNGSLKRHFTRIICRYELPDEKLGMLVNTAFNLLSPNEDIAVRANAMQILYNISQSEPDLKQELSSVLETLLAEETSAAIASRGKRLLIKLRN
mgnify:FL=1